jgi:hypothetical protein
VEAHLRGLNHPGVSRPQIVNDPREQRGQAHPSSGQQDVEMPSLGDASAVCIGPPQAVTLDNRHSVETLGQGSRDSQSRQAAAQHNRVVTHLNRLRPTCPITVANSIFGSHVIATPRR